MRCESGEHTAKVPEWQCGWETEPQLAYGKDVAYARYIASWAEENACVDTRNVFTMGHSNGAARRLAAPLPPINRAGGD
eukprot:gene18108-4897_t